MIQNDEVKGGDLVGCETFNKGSLSLMSCRCHAQPEIVSILTW